MTLNGIMAVIMRYYITFVTYEANYVKLVADSDVLFATEM